MRMEAGLDTGPVLLTRETPIGAEDTAADLHDRLAALGAGAIVGRSRNSALVAVPQDDALATYAEKVTKDEARIDWTARPIRWPPYPRPVALSGAGVWPGTSAEIAARTAVRAGAPGVVLAATRSCPRNGRGRDRRTAARRPPGDGCGQYAASICLNASPEGCHPARASSSARSFSGWPMALHPVPAHVMPRYS